MEAILAYLRTLTIGQIEKLANNLDEIGRLADRLIGRSKWLSLFGEPAILDDNFNSTHFLYGTEQDVAEPICFDQATTGYEALVQIEQMGRKPASLAAQGRYVVEHREAVRMQMHVGIGARWTDEVGDVWTPVYFEEDGGFTVDLDTLDVSFPTGTRFLVRKKT